MRKFKGATQVGYGPENIKGRIVLMSVALVFIVGALFWMQLSGSTEPEQPDEQPAPTTERIALPEVFPGTFDGVRDAEPADQRVLEADELKVLRTIVRRTTAGAIADAGAATLDGEVHARVLAAPDDARGEWFQVRGELLAVDEKDAGPGSSETEFVGTLRTHGDALVHFRMQRTDDDELAVGDWVRVAGVFFKNLLRDAGDDARLAPLIVGPQMLRSFEDFGEVTSITPEQWDSIRDDTFDFVTGPQDAMRWRLLAWMRDRPQVDREEGELTELSDELLSQISRDGSEFRGQSFKLPVSRVQAATARSAGENPARLDTYSVVWIGNMTWKREPVICVQLPGGIENYPPGQFVEGEVVFFMNIAYDTATERHVAPLFVAKSIDEFVPERDITLHVLLIGAAVFFIGLILTMFVLLRRDRKRSELLARQLVERRRARRAAAATAGATD